MNFPKPFGDRILVKRKKAESKIIFTQNEKNEGEIVAVGQNTKQNPIRLKIGQNVIFTGYGTTQIPIEEDKENQYILMCQKEVLAVLS